jgi:hypothetical protein
MGSCLWTGLAFSLFLSALIMRIDAGEFGSSSGGPNHLVIEGPSSDGSRVAASFDVNSLSPSIRSVPNDEESHPSPSQWASVFLVLGALYVLLFLWHHGRDRIVEVCIILKYSDTLMPNILYSSMLSMISAAASDNYIIAIIRAANDGGSSS